MLFGDTDDHGESASGKVRKTAASVESDYTWILRQGPVPGGTRIIDFVQAYVNGHGAARWGTASTGETPTPYYSAASWRAKENQTTPRRVAPMTISERCRRAVHLPQFKRKWSKGLKRWLTWCNQFVDYIARAYNCPWFEGHYANDIIQIILMQQASFHEVGPDQAQHYANENHLVIAGWFNPEGHPGHVAIIVEGHLVWSKQFRDDVPNCANVGATNFYGRPVSYGFNKKMKPRYWLFKPGGINGNH